jgi:hypothetical protein
LKCFTAKDAVLHTADQRTIAISRLSTDFNIEQLIKQIDQVSPVLLAEYALKYYNPQSVSTDEMLTFLRDPEFLSERPSFMRDREVQLHERDDDKINVIYLDGEHKPKKTESYSLLLHKEAFPRVYSPSFVPEESIEGQDPLVFWTNTARK